MRTTLKVCKNKFVFIKLFLLHLIPNTMLVVYKKKAVFLFCCCITYTISMQAQVITMQEAVDKALQNNISIQLKILQEKQAATTVTTAYDIPKTIVNTELGSINTSNFDTRLNVHQTFALPKLYKAQKSVLQQILQQQQWQTKLQKAEIKRLVQIAYGEIQYLQMLQKVLKRVDSIYTKFQQKASLRFSKGETNLLEKTTLDNMVNQNLLEIENLSIDIAAAKMQLSILMNTTNSFETSIEFQITNVLYDSVALQQHPFIKAIEQQQQIAQQQIAVEKAKLLPDVSFGYSNQSIIGWQTNKDRSENFFNAGNRFSIVQAGIAVPIFTKAQKGKLEAAKQQSEIANKQTTFTQQQFLKQVQQATFNKKKQEQSVQYFQQSALPQSETIIKTATLQYNNGAINYIEWGMLLNNAFAIQTQHQQTMWEYFKANVEMAYLYQIN